MPSLPPGMNPDNATVLARRGLLDALEALREHQDAIVLVGAQAVYLRTHDAGFSVSAYTMDADLGVDPALLDDEPLLEALMRKAGFGLRNGIDPGMWMRRQDNFELEVDLLVPATLVPGGRGARIPPHDKRAARKVLGLEVAIVDNDVLTVGSLEPDDRRTAEVKVASAAALLVAKAYKLGEREDLDKSRLLDKDAADVYRLVATADPYAVAERFSHLMNDDRVGPVVRQGLTYLRRLFGGRDTTGVRMAIAALAGAGPGAAEIETVATAFISQLPTGA